MPIAGAPSDMPGLAGPGSPNGETRKLGGRPSKQALAEAKLTEGNFRRIARATNLTPQHVGRVIKGAVNTTLTTAYQIAKAAGVTLDELYEYARRREAQTEEATGVKIERKKKGLVKKKPPAGKKK